MNSTYYRTLEQLDYLAGESWVDIHAQEIETQFKLIYAEDIKLRLGNPYTYALAIIDNIAD